MRSTAVIRLGLALSIVGLTACATRGPLRSTPAAVLARPALAYEAGFRATALAPVASDGRYNTSTRTAEVEVLLLRLGADEARALEGEEVRGPSAWITPRAELAPYFALSGTADERVLAAPHLTGAEGRTNAFAAVKQAAYLADYAMRGDAGALVVDPVVETYTTGLALEARAACAADERLALDLELRHCAPVGRQEESEMVLPGFPDPVVVQVPRLCTQRIETHASLAADECLVLSWNDAEASDRRLFALVRARALAMGTD